MPALSADYGLLLSYLLIVKDEHSIVELHHTSLTTLPPLQVLCARLAAEAGSGSCGLTQTGIIVSPDG